MRSPIREVFVTPGRKKEPVQKSPEKYEKLEKKVIAKSETKTSVS